MMNWDIQSQKLQCILSYNLHIMKIHTLQWFTCYNFPFCDTHICSTAIIYFHYTYCSPFCKLWQRMFQYNQGASDCRHFPFLEVTLKPFLPWDFSHCKLSVHWKPKMVLMQVDSRDWCPCLSFVLTLLVVFS